MYKSKKPYHYGTGRRKSSVARVHLFPNGTGSITINGRDIDEYFGLETLKLLVRQPLVTTDTTGKVDIVATVTGGGVTGQAGAIRHGVARALLQMNEEYRPALKSAGFLTRDPRMKERKKYGLKAARRAALRPYFLRSFILGSRVSRPAAFKMGRYSSLTSRRARATPWRMAPAWPVTPPPVTVATMSTLPSCSVATRGWRTSSFRVSRPKYSSMSRPLMVMEPVPFWNRWTRATEDFRRPVP